MPHDLVAGDAGNVSEAATRVDSLLAAARAAFVEKGFDGASMQDLARAAGMSAGNFYRYYPSKAAIVEAMVARDLAAVEDSFREIAASPDPLAALRIALRRAMSENCGHDDTLWAEIAATAVRRPEIAVILERMEEAIVRRVAHVMGLAAGLSEDEAVRRFRAPARLVFIIMHGAMTSRIGRDPADEPVAGLVVRTIERIIRDAIAEAEER
jgi:AcrR family transcriptional regulator